MTSIEREHNINYTAHKNKYHTPQQYMTIDKQTIGNKNKPNLCHRQNRHTS